MRREDIEANVSEGSGMGGDIGMDVNIVRSDTRGWPLRCSFEFSMHEYSA